MRLSGGAAKAAAYNPAEALLRVSDTKKNLTQNSNKRLAPPNFHLSLNIHGGGQRWSCFFDQNAARLRWIRVSHQAAILESTAKYGAIAVGSH